MELGGLRERACTFHVGVDGMGAWDKGAGSGGGRPADPDVASVHVCVLPTILVEIRFLTLHAMNFGGSPHTS